MDAVMSIVAGAAVLTVVTIAGGGAFLLGTAGSAQTPIQRAFFRAGHAHAGVLVILGLVCVLLQRSSGVTDGWQFAAIGILLAAILMPLGFFASVWAPGSQQPNRWIRLVWAGGIVLVVSLIAVGVTVIMAGTAALPT